MKTVLQFLLIGLILTTTSSAQITFQDNLPAGFYTSVISTSDNGYLAGGYTSNYSPSTNIFGSYFIKLNNTGNLEWTKAVNLPDTSCITRAVVETATGYVAIADGDSFILIIQLDKQGNVIATKKIGQLDHPACTRMITTNDGGYAITGSALNNGLWGVLFIKLDKDLNVQGAESIIEGLGDQYTIGNSMIQTSDSFYVFTGKVSDEFLGISDQVLTIKTNSKGKVIWANLLGGDNIDQGQDIVETHAGNYFIEGLSDSLITASDFLFLQYDTAGNIIWEKKAGNTHADDEPRALVKTNDGGYAAWGDTYPTIPFIYKFDSSFNLLWTKSYPKFSIPASFAVCPDNGFILIDGYVHLAKTDTLGTTCSSQAGNFTLRDIGFKPYKTYTQVKKLDFTETDVVTYDSSGGDVHQTCLVLASTVNQLKASVNNRSVVLQWNYPEINATHFEIERSISGSNNFIRIGTVAANTTTQYKYTDASPVNGKNYYRLKIVDTDGKYEYSKIVSATLNNGNTISVYPNPAKNNLYVEGLSSNKTKLTVIDYLGKVEFQATANNMNYTLNIASLPAGNYLLKIEMNDEVVTKKFVKE